MGLVLDISAAQTTLCGTLVITDTTGKYSATNLTGWSTVEMGTSDTIVINDSSITEAELIITVDGVATTIDLMDVTNWQTYTPYTEGSPFDSSTDPDSLTFTFTPANLGLSVFADQHITVEYYIKDNLERETDNDPFLIFLYCTVKRLYHKALAMVPDKYQCVECNNDFIDDVILISGLYKALKEAVCLGDTATFDTLLEILEEIFTLKEITIE